MNPLIKQALEFTETYKEYIDAPIEIREALCFKAQYPALLPDIREGDVFAGHRASERLAYVGSVYWYGVPDYSPTNVVEGKQGGYCFDFTALYKMPLDEDERQVLEELSGFWKSECTMAKVFKEAEMRDGTGFLFTNNIIRLVKEGLPGLRRDVEAMSKSDLKTGLTMVLETVTDVCRFYVKQAEERQMFDIANNISAIINSPPQTLAQALQLILIFELLSHDKHYELNRLDVAVGDIYAKELESGAITETQAIEMVLAFYEMIYINGERTVCRLIMGGQDRPNEVNADKFVKVALKAEQLHKKVIPQVSLRIYDDMNPDLFDLAYDTINESYTFPAIYNDETIIGGVAEAFDISFDEAKQYYPLGCGEFIIANKSPAVLVAGWSVPKTVDEGIRAFVNSGGDPGTFDDLYQSVLVATREQANIFARYHKLVIDKNKGDCAFLMACLLNDDCIKREKHFLDGGAIYSGACVMGHGFSNGADALIAIKKLVYDDAKYTLKEILDALDADFEGYEDIKRDMISAPKYGNDNVEVDEMVARLWRDISDESKNAGKECGLDFLTISSVNPGGYHLGEAMGATADGRHKGQAFAIGNSPSAGSDKSGLTALINSILKTDPVNGGSITNFKISRDFFTNEREKFKALFSTYWGEGGLQANFNVINKGDLEAAMNEPDKFPHLLVRLGGWTARFIDLTKFQQEEILKRTLY